MSINNAFAISPGTGGKYFSSIDFSINENLTTATFRQNSNGAILGTLSIGQAEFRINSEEIDHLISTLQRAKEVVNKKYIMNLM